MREVRLWKVLVAFLLTLAAVYALALWQGPLGFYGSGVYSVPTGSAPSLASIFVFALVVNAVWWVVILLPSGIKRPAPT